MPRRARAAAQSMEESSDEEMAAPPAVDDEALLAETTAALDAVEASEEDARLILDLEDLTGVAGVSDGGLARAARCARAWAARGPGGATLWNSTPGETWRPFLAGSCAAAARWLDGARRRL